MRLAPVLALVLACAAASAATGEQWSLATRRDGARTIVYRYICDLGAKAGERDRQPDRVTLSWRYDAAANNGMPTDAEAAGMDDLENALDKAVEQDGFANLALVRTGGGLREWTYYTTSGPAFVQRMNEAIQGRVNAPLEVDVRPDPRWTAWDDVLKQLTSR